MWVFSPSFRPPRFSFFPFPPSNDSLRLSKIIAGESPKTHRLQDVGSWMWSQFILETLRNSWLPRALTFLFQAEKSIAFPYSFACFFLRCLISIDFWFVSVTKCNLRLEWILEIPNAAVSFVSSAFMRYTLYTFCSSVFYAWNLEHQDFHRHLLMLFMEILPLSPETIFDDFRLPNTRHIHTFRFWIWVSSVNCISICLCCAKK